MEKLDLHDTILGLMSIRGQKEKIAITSMAWLAHAVVPNIKKTAYGDDFFGPRSPEVVFAFSDLVRYNFIHEISNGMHYKYEVSPDGKRISRDAKEKFPVQWNALIELATLCKSVKLDSKAIRYAVYILTHGLKDAKSDVSEWGGMTTKQQRLGIKLYWSILKQYNIGKNIIIDKNLNTVCC